MIMNSHPKISIIVPVYNVERYLRECVDSILSQTFADIEMILVDDGSNDNSGKICDEYACKDKRVVVVHKENGGLSSARNAGLDVACGDYIGFVDSDDYISKDMYATLYQLIISKDSDIAMCGYFDVYAHSITTKSKRQKTYFVDQMKAIKIVLKGRINSTTVWNKLYKRYIFETLRFRTGKTMEDDFLVLDSFLKCRMVSIITSAKYYYRHREDSICTRKFTSKDLDVIEAYEYNSKIAADHGQALKLPVKGRLCWANFYVLDKLLSSSNHQEQVRLLGEVSTFLKKNACFILVYNQFRLRRKIAFLGFLIHPGIYKLALGIKNSEEKLQN